MSKWCILHHLPFERKGKTVRLLPPILIIIFLASCSSISSVPTIETPFTNFSPETMNQAADWTVCPECPRDKVQITILPETEESRTDLCPIKKGLFNRSETTALVFMLNDDRYYNYWLNGLEMIMCSKMRYTRVNTADNTFYVPNWEFNQFINATNLFYRTHCQVSPITERWTCPLEHHQSGETG